MRVRESEQEMDRLSNGSDNDELVIFEPAVLLLSNVRKYVRTFMSVDAIATPTESNSAAASSGVGTGTSEMSSLKGNRMISEK